MNHFIQILAVKFVNSLCVTKRVPKVFSSASGTWGKCVVAEGE